MIKKGVFLLVSSFLYLISLLPFPLLYLISDGLYALLFYVFRYRRAVVEENLLNSFPEKSAGERKAIAKKFYRFFADLLVESIKMLSITKKEITSRFSFADFNEVTKHFEAGKSVLVTTGHYGNWEWGTHIISVMIPQKVLVVYKPLSDKRFEQFFNNMRSKFGAIMVAMKNTLRKLIEFKTEQYLAVFVSDQTPAKADAHHFIDFLNQPTAVFMGVEKIARMTANPVVFCTIDRCKRGYYKATFKTLTADPENEPEFAITKAHTVYLENVIREKPELWLWSHRRWKFKPEDLR